MIDPKSFVAVLYVDLIIPHSGSLKTKRRVLLSLKAKIKNRFNASVSEIGEMDKWQRAVLGISIINSDKSYLNREMQKIISLIDSEHEIEILDSDTEIIT